MSTKASTTQWKISFYLFVAALLTRIVTLIFNNGFLTQALSNDAHRYDMMARHLLETGDYVFQGHKAMIAPLYPTFLAGVYALPVPERLTVIIIQILLGALTSVLVYRIGLHIFHHRTALVAGIITAIYTSYVFIPLNLYTESLFLPLLAASLLFTVRFHRFGGTGDITLAAILTALACLTRPLIFYLPPIFVIAVTWINYRKGTRIPLKALLIYLAAFYLCMSPWAVRNHNELGRPVFTSTSVGGLLAASVMPREGKLYGYNIRPKDLKIEDSAYYYLPELERSDALKQIALNHLLENPEKIPYLFFLKCIYLVSPFDWEVMGHTEGILNPMFIMLFILGIWGLYKTDSRQGRGIILGLLLYLFAFSYVTYSSPRLRLPLELPLMFFAAAGWNEYEKMSSTRTRFAVLAVAAIIVVTGTVFSAEIKDSCRVIMEWVGLW